MNLNASMQLGQRILPDEEQWDDEKPSWTWGNNKEWVANKVNYRTNASESLPFGQQMEPYQGQEFKIEKSKLSSSFSLLIIIVIL